VKPCVRFGWLAFSLLPIAAIGGCVSIDSRSWREAIAKDSLARLTGEYENRASYFSGTSFTTPKTFFEMVFPNDAEPSRFMLSYDEHKGLVVRFSIEGMDGAIERSHLPGKDLTVDRDGEIHISFETPCGPVGSGDNLYLDCASRSVSVFVNPSGELVAVETTRELANFFLLPVAKFVKIVAIFPRARQQVD
jgi:hypothetical protein